MTRAAPAILAALFAALAPRASAGAALRLDATLKCTVRSGLSQYIRQGSMLPVILRFENTGAPRVIRVQTGGLVRSSKVFSVPTGRMVKRCLYVPVSFECYLGADEPRFFDVGSRRDLGPKRPQTWGGYSGPRFVARGGAPAWSAGPGPTTLLIGALVEGRKSGGLVVHDELDPRFQLETTRVPAEVLPDDWRGYSSLDVLVVEHEAWARPGFAKEPVINWMSMGGVLLIVGAPPEGRARFKQLLGKSAAFFRARTVPAPGTPAVRPGDSPAPRNIEQLLVGIGGAAFVSEQFLRERHPGFLAGRGLEEGLVARLSAPYGPGAPAVPGGEELPFWPVLLSLVLFVVLVGPLGWWYLVRRKRHALLYYVAAPAASVLAIALMIALQVLHEGIQPHVNCVAVRLVDQRVNKCIEMSQFGLYRPFGFATGLTGRADEIPHFFSLAERSEYVDVALDCRESGESRHYSGVAPTRTKVWFGREVIRRERRRLVVWKEDGRLFVENHLGCPLERLLVVHEGKGTLFESVGAGAKKSGEPLTPSALAFHIGRLRTTFRDLAQGSILAKVGPLCFPKRGQLLSGNAYCAVSTGPAPDQTWLDSFRDQGSKTMIFGVY